MLRDLVSRSDFTMMPEISVAMFIVAFVGILVWTYRRNAARHYDRMGRMALEDGQANGETRDE